MPEPKDQSKKIEAAVEKQVVASEKQAVASEKQAVASEKQVVESKKQATSSERQAASSEELDKAQKEVVVLLKSIRYLNRLMLGVIVVTLAVISVCAILTVRIASDAESASKSNNEFLGNFSNYMRCLVINDDEVVAAYGEEKYFDLCDELLFQGTGERPKKVVVTVPDPNATPTTTRPTSPPATIRGG